MMGEIKGGFIEEMGFALVLGQWFELDWYTLMGEVIGRGSLIL